MKPTSRTRRASRSLSWWAVLLTLTALIAVDVSRAPAGQAAIAPPLTVQPVVGGLAIPWDVAFTPDGTMLFDQRAGGISARRSNGVVTLMTTPADFVDLAVVGESGLLGLAVDPAFNTNRFIYTCQSHKSGTAAITDVRVIQWQVNSTIATWTRSVRS